MLTQIKPNLYQMKTQLPNNPLKNINSYILTSPSRNLIIDTAFRIPACLEEIQKDLETLGLDMAKTDILATHLHGDHTGLIPDLMSDTSVIYMGDKETKIYQDMKEDLFELFYNEMEEHFSQEGYPIDELVKAKTTNQGRVYSAQKKFPITPLKEGDSLSYGEYSFTVIDTPGHTPGHICLYDMKNQILIAADHVLFGITPNITRWQYMDDALGEYLASLDKVAKLDVTLTLTGHRENDGVLRERVEELRAHHKDRLEDVLAIVKEQPGISGYDIAGKMHWSIRAKDWADFPPGQRWFAVGEAISHLDHLVICGKLKRELVNGITSYRLDS